MVLKLYLFQCLVALIVCANALAIPLDENKMEKVKDVALEKALLNSNAEMEKPTGSTDMESKNRVNKFVVPGVANSGSYVNTIGGSASGYGNAGLYNPYGAGVANTGSSVYGAGGVASGYSNVGTYNPYGAGVAYSGSSSYSAGGSAASYGSAVIAG